jgi:hypothetical protein
VPVSGHGQEQIPYASCTSADTEVYDILADGFSHTKDGSSVIEFGTRRLPHLALHSAPSHRIVARVLRLVGSARPAPGTGR